MLNVLNRRAKILILIAVIALAVAIPITIIQVQKQQEIRQRAASDFVSFEVSPQNSARFLSGGLKPDGSLLIDIYFINTDSPKNISAFEIPIVYDTSSLSFVESTVPHTFSSAVIEENPAGTLRYIWFQDPKNPRALVGRELIANLSFKTKSGSAGKTAKVDFSNPLVVDADSQGNLIQVLNNKVGSYTITAAGAAAPQDAVPTAFPCPVGAITGCFSAPPNTPNAPMEVFLGGVCPTLSPNTTQTCYTRVFPTSTPTSVIPPTTAPTNTPTATPQQTYSCIRKNYNIQTPINTPQCSGTLFETTNYCSWTNDATDGCIVSYIITCIPSSCNPSVPIPTPTPTPGPRQPQTGSGSWPGVQQQFPFATPLPTVAPGTTRFTLALTLEGIGIIPGSPKNLERRATIKVDRVGSPQSPFSITKTVVLAYNFDQTNQAGKFGGILDLQTLLPTGNFKILVQIPGYLQRAQTLRDHTQVSGPSAASGENIPINISSPLYTGDINGDNVLNALDYGVIQSCFGARATTGSCTFKTISGTPFADINDDGAVNGVDYILFLKSLSSGRTGDS